MIARELQDRNQQTIASSYAGEMPENVQERDMNVKVHQHESFIGSADRDQHEATGPTKTAYCTTEASGLEPEHGATF